MPGQALMHGKQKVIGDSSCQPPACTLLLYKLSNCKGWRTFVAWASCSAAWKAMNQIPNKNTKVPEIFSFPSFGCLCSGSALLQHSIRKRDQLWEKAL